MKGDNSRYAYIDLGVSNVCTLSSNAGQSVIFNGRPLKSVNAWYNKKKAKLRSSLNGKRHTSKRIKRLTGKRNKITNKHSDVYGYWCIEPRYSRKVEKETLRKYHNLCYHYTTKENVDSILKNGLRIKKSIDFGYPERIYVMLLNKKDVFSDETIRFVKKQIGSEKVYKEGGLECVQVNLNKISIDVYKDTTIPDDNTYFIYNNIPPSCLKLVDK